MFDCKDCILAKTRTQIVWGRGNPEAPLMIIGEAPGKDEDRTGLPFVGKAGELLNVALEEAGLTEEHFYITNMVKCRPPGNRNPTKVEMDACFNHLSDQMHGPVSCASFVILLGKVAAEYLLQRPVKITKENGKLDVLEDGTLIMIVYHPAYVLRNQKPEVRRDFFQAIKDAGEIAYGAP